MLSVWEEGPAGSVPIFLPYESVEHPKILKSAHHADDLSGRHRTPPELQAAWIRHLRWFFDFYNYQYAKGQLRPPIFRLGSSRGRLGEWNPERRTITISESHILENSWPSVLDTLRHEMAHQYVHEVMQLSGVSPHGEEFGHACRILRCEAECCANEEALKPLGESELERDRILVRVRDLLALADSPNEHEAANAMRLAHKYLLKYNLSLRDLRAESADEIGASSSYRVRYLGRCARRIQEYEYTLSEILQEHFFVLILWTYSYDPHEDKLGRILQVAGIPANVEVAEYVYGYLTNLADALWSGRRKKPREVRGTKLQYLAGVFSGLLEKLDRQKGELKREHGLVWRGDAELKKFYKHVNPRTYTTSGGGVSRGSGYYDGVEDGRNITIRRPIGGGATNRGRALRGRGSRE
ncbi:MAG: SprT-like domain-containing protein [Planctomycetes bacterium]|nr:SprT-like domain-containing protein [Planctomycetota bacterium]